MGMLDYIHIQYDLPLPIDVSQEHASAIKKYLKNNLLQTKNLECLMYHYLIGKDGFFYNKTFKINNYGTLDPKFYEIKKKYIHQHIVCYSFVPVELEKIDYWLEYNIKFTDGKIQEAMVEWKRLPNSQHFLKFD